MPIVLRSMRSLSGLIGSEQDGPLFPSCLSDREQEKSRQAETDVCEEKLYCDLSSRGGALSAGRIVRAIPYEDA